MAADVTDYMSLFVAILFSTESLAVMKFNPSRKKRTDTDNFLVTVV
jgi:hypothetical protein